MIQTIIVDGPLRRGQIRRDNLYFLSEAERKQQGVDYLPRTLAEALDAFEADPLAKEVFGEEMFASYLKYKRDE